MAEVLNVGDIINWESVDDIYAEEVVGINIYEQSVLITLAVNRVEPGKSVGARTVRQCVARLVLPFATANALVVALGEAGRSARFDIASAANEGKKPS